MRMSKQPLQLQKIRLCANKSSQNPGSANWGFGYIVRPIQIAAPIGAAVVC